IEFDLPARQLPFGHYIIAVIPKSSLRGDAERRTRNPEVVAEIPGSRWRAPRNDVPGSERRSADEQTITLRDGPWSNIPARTRRVIVCTVTVMGHRDGTETSSRIDLA